MKRLTPSQITDIIKLYLAGQSPKDIGHTYNIRNNSVTRILRKNNITRNQRNIITDIQKKYICKEYIKGKNSEKIAKELSIHPTTVCKIIKSNNIKIRPGFQNKRKYLLNETWLDEIDTQEKAYFLGLFWADGNISKRGNGISLRLHSQDKNILIKLSEYFYYKDRVSHYIEDTNKPSTPISRLCIYSAYIKNRMLELGLFPNKSKKIKFPKCNIIDENALPHFIRGLMDGDGCICVRENGRCTVDFTGNKFIIHSLEEIFNIRNIKTRTFYYEKRDSWSIQINNKENIIKFLDWIYHDSSIHLERKYDKYKQITKHD